MNIIPNLMERILALDADAKVTVRGDDYDQIEWHAVNTNPSPPSAAACQAVDLVAIQHQKTIAYAKTRLESDPILFVLTAELVKLKSAAEGITLQQAKLALLAALENV